MAAAGPRRDSVEANGTDGARGVYSIAVAAELVGMGVQNLRAYEARGLLEPGRTGGGTRRYSALDLDRLRRIGELLQAGLNLAGIAMVLELETRLSHALASGRAHSPGPRRSRSDGEDGSRAGNATAKSTISRFRESATERAAGGHHGDRIHHPGDSRQVVDGELG
jgi:MerR family transcriptional regulator/heat shock protein HspR